MTMTGCEWCGVGPEDECEVGCPAPRCVRPLAEAHVDAVDVRRATPDDVATIVELVDHYRQVRGSLGSGQVEGQESLL